jgi:hypothetical protein
LWHYIFILFGGEYGSILCFLVTFNTLWEWPITINTDRTFCVFRRPGSCVLLEVVVWQWIFLGLLLLWNFLIIWNWINCYCLETFWYGSYLFNCANFSWNEFLLKDISCVRVSLNSWRCDVIFCVFLCFCLIYFIFFPMFQEPFLLFFGARWFNYHFCLCGPTWD